MKYIDFDVGKIKELKERYEATKQLISEMMSPINLEKPSEIKQFFENELDIKLDNARITTIQEYMGNYDHDSMQYDAINGVVMYLKIKYSLKNYINCILKHEENGRVYLRQVNGTWMMPNKQPLSRNPEITECILHEGETYE